jgi:chaperone BCS1
MIDQGAQQRSPHLAVQTFFKQHENGAVSTEFSLVPGPGKHWFRWHGAWMQVSKLYFILNRKRDINDQYALC